MANTRADRAEEKAKGLEELSDQLLARNEQLEREVKEATNLLEKFRGNVSVDSCSLEELIKLEFEMKEGIALPASLNMPPEVLCTHFQAERR